MNGADPWQLQEQIEHRQWIAHEAALLTVHDDLNINDNGAHGDAPPCAEIPAWYGHLSKVELTQ